MPARGGPALGHPKGRVTGPSATRHTGHINKSIRGMVSQGTGNLCAGKRAGRIKALLTRDAQCYPSFQLVTISAKASVRNAIL